MSFTDDYEGMDAQDAYNKKLQDELDQLHAHRQALEQEFSNLDPDDPSTHKKVREHIHTLVPMAGATVAQLMEHSESDSVRANLAKFVLIEASKSVSAEKPVDIVAQIFADLAKNDAIADSQD